MRPSNRQDVAQSGCSRRTFCLRGLPRRPRRRTNSQSLLVDWHLPLLEVVSYSSKNRDQFLRTHRRVGLQPEPSEVRDGQPRLFFGRIDPLKAYPASSGIVSRHLPTLPLGVLPFDGTDVIVLGSRLGRVFDVERAGGVTLRPCLGLRC